MGKVVLVIGALGLTIFALIDLFGLPASGVRGGSRFVWAVLILLVPVIGPALWLWLGRAGDGPKRRGLGPDDDPDFLRGLPSG
jgi:hypothetical protein